MVAVSQKYKSFWKSETTTLSQLEAVAIRPINVVVIKQYSTRYNLHPQVSLADRSVFNCVSVWLIIEEFKPPEGDTNIDISLDLISEQFWSKRQITTIEL